MFLVDTGYAISFQSSSFSYRLNLLILSGLAPISSHLSPAITAHLKHLLSNFSGFIIAFFLLNQSGSFMQLAPLVKFNLYMLMSI